MSLQFPVTSCFSAGRLSLSGLFCRDLPLPIDIVVPIRQDDHSPPHQIVWLSHSQPEQQTGEIRPERFASSSQSMPAAHEPRSEFSQRFPVFNEPRPSGSDLSCDQVEAGFDAAFRSLEVHDFITAERWIQQSLRILASGPAEHAGLTCFNWLILAVQALFKSDEASCVLWLRQCERDLRARSLEPNVCPDASHRLAADVEMVIACRQAASGCDADALAHFAAAAKSYRDARHLLGSARALVLQARVHGAVGRHEESGSQLDLAERLLGQLKSSRTRDQLQSAIRSDRARADAIRKRIDRACWN